MKTKQTKKYVAPKMELIEMEPREVLCVSTDMGTGIMAFGAEENLGQWVAP
jgi:hypothetical protein